MTSSFCVSQPLQLFKFPLVFKYKRVTLKAKIEYYDSAALKMCHKIHFIIASVFLEFS